MCIRDRRHCAVDHAIELRRAGKRQADIAVLVAVGQHAGPMVEAQRGARPARHPEANPDGPVRNQLPRLLIQPAELLQRPQNAI